MAPLLEAEEEDALDDDTVDLGIEDDEEGADFLDDEPAEEEAEAEE